MKRNSEPGGSAFAALSAFHVSIDPNAESDDRPGSSGAGTKEEWRTQEDSNL